MVNFRSPKRISITVSNATYDSLVRRSDREGRSLSNLAAYLLEASTDQTRAAEKAGIAAGKIIPFAA